MPCLLPVFLDGCELSCNDEVVQSLSVGTYGPKTSNYLKD